MSIPRRDSIWGELLYRGKKYGVLNGFKINQDMLKKYNQYRGDKMCLYSSAPWHTTNVSWVIEDNKLYLTQLCGKGLLQEFFGSEKILADWVSEMQLLKNHEKVCKTYEIRGSTLNRIKILNLSFTNGELVDKQSREELYISKEMKRYIDSYTSYSTLRIDSVDLKWYLKENRISTDDLFFPILKEHIKLMTQNSIKDNSHITIENFYELLESGEVAIIGSSQSDDINEMVGSLVESMLDEVYKTKGYMVHITTNEEYPIEKIVDILNLFEKMIGYGINKKGDTNVIGNESILNIEFPIVSKPKYYKEKLDYKSNFNKRIFRYGRSFSSDLREGEIIIRVVFTI